MSLFEKLKKLHSGAPAPPRRTDDNARFEWPQDEFDEEDGDMYEAPPCERSLNSGPPRQVMENEYMERMSNPIVPQRPPPRLSKVSKLPPHDKPNYSSEISKPPDVDRTEKPGRKMPPPPMRSAPISQTSTEEDVYLDPNEEQDSCEELYLEPTDACSPHPPRGAKMVLPFPMTAHPAPKPLLKPPVPRAKSSSPMSSVNELKTGPSVEARRSSFPNKPPTPCIKPPLPASLKEVKSSPQNPPVVENKPLAYSGDGRVNKQSGIENKEWFAGDCNRKMAEDLLLRINKDGAFLIRHSSSQNSRQPYTLAVLYQQKVYNIPVRFLEETHAYALGKEGKKNEEIFGTLDEMISYHKNNQLLLIDSKSWAKNTTYLTYAAHP